MRHQPPTHFFVLLFLYFICLMEDKEPPAKRIRVDDVTSEENHAPLGQETEVWYLIVRSLISSYARDWQLFCLRAAYAKSEGHDKEDNLWKSDKQDRIRCEAAAGTTLPPGYPRPFVLAAGFKNDADRIR